MLGSKDEAPMRLSRSEWRKKIQAHFLTYPVDADLMAAIEGMQPIPPVILDIYGNHAELHDAIRNALMETLATELKQKPEDIVSAGLGLLGLPFSNPQSARRILYSAPRRPEQQIYSAFMNSLFAPFMQTDQPQRALLLWLHALVSTWNRLKAQNAPFLAFPFVPTLRIRQAEPNPTMDDDAGYLQLMRLLKGFESGVLPALAWRSFTPQAQFGGFVFFTIVLGALIHDTRRQMVFKRALTQPLDEPYASVLLPRDRKTTVAKLHETNAVQGIETYRWIADPVSARIHHKFSKKWRSLSWDARLPARCLQQFLTQVRQSLQAQQTSLRTSFSGEDVDLLETAFSHLSNIRALIAASRVYQRRRLPAVLWHYLENDFVTHDLNVVSLKRLNVFKPRSNGLELVLNQPETSAEIDAPETDEFDQAMHWVHASVQLIRGFKGGDATACQMQLDMLTRALELVPDSFIYALTSWIKSLLTDSAVSDTQRLKWVRTLLPRVIEHFALNENINDLDNDERIEEFDDMAAASGDNTQTLKALFGAWVSFHQHLITRGAIHVDQARFVMLQARPRVDAQYVNEAEFERAKAAIGKAPLTPEMKNMVLLTMIVSYRMGLRRSEVTKLSTQHMMFKDGLLDVVRVAWWSQRRLKTPSSTRTIPIQGLLTLEEEAWLSLWVVAKTRGLRIHAFLPTLTHTQHANYLREFLTKPLLDKEHFLFLTDNCLASAKTREIQVKRIVEHVQDALKTAIGNDEPIRFHHLRHSCATNTLLLLFANQLPNSINFAMDLMYGKANCEARFKSFKGRVSRIRQALLCHHGAQNSDLYAVSRLLGHSSPMTTLKSYTHSVDLLLGAAIHERYVALPKGLRTAIHPDAPKIQRKKTKSLKVRNRSHTLTEYDPIGRPKSAPKF